MICRHYSSSLYFTVNISNSRRVGIKIENAEKFDMENKRIITVRWSFFLFRKFVLSIQSKISSCFCCRFVCSRDSPVPVWMYYYYHHHHHYRVLDYEINARVGTRDVYIDAFNLYDLCAYYFDICPRKLINIIISRGRCNGVDIILRFNVRLTGHHHFYRIPIVKYW